MSRESDCVRAFEYMMAKYAKKYNRLHTLGKRTKLVLKEVPIRSFVTREEHDRILSVYASEKITLAELARRVGRSETCVFRIVKGIHPLSHEKK